MSKKKSLKGVKRQKELWYSELRGSLLNHNKYVLSEHIFINIIIKLTLKRYCKYRKENEYRERKTHQNKQKKGTSESSRPDNNVRSKPESNIRYSTDRKGSETKKTAIFTALQHPHSKVPPPHVLPHNGTQTRNCTWEMTLYIKKKQHQAVWKQRSASNKLNHHYYYLKSYKVLLATSKENQWSKLSFSFFLFLRFLFLVNSDWNQFVFETCE